MEIILATTNIHKAREIREMLKKNKRLNSFDFLSLRNFPDYQQPEENGLSLKENAEIKAIHAAKTLGKWAIADDSGLIVPALNGAPGIHSARFAGPKATDTENRKKLLTDMKDLTNLDRRAYCECWLTLASPEGIVKSVSGVCEGYILEEEKGRNGFGYDNLFIKLDHSVCFAEMPPETKNEISHRGKAFLKFSLILERFIESTI